MAVAVFDYSAWATRFPALAASVDEPTALAYFAEATDFLDNSDCSLVQDVNQRLRFLNLIVAHIACCSAASATGAAGLVGRVSSATEGSVTIGTELKGFAGDYGAYFSQTPYGTQYWTMVAGYRAGGIYRPGVRPYLGVPGAGGGFGWQL